MQSLKFGKGLKISIIGVRFDSTFHGNIDVGLVDVSRVDAIAYEFTRPHLRDGMQRQEVLLYRKIAAAVMWKRGQREPK